MHTVHAHTHTHRPTRPRDGWPSPLGNARKHYLSPSSPEERDALLKIDTLATAAASPASPRAWKSARACGAAHAGRCLLLILSWVLGGLGDHRSTSSSFKTSQFILHFSEALRRNHSQHVQRLHAFSSLAFCNESAGFIMLTVSF